MSYLDWFKVGPCRRVGTPRRSPSPASASWRCPSSASGRVTDGLSVCSDQHELQQLRGSGSCGKCSLGGSSRGATARILHRDRVCCDSTPVSDGVVEYGRAGRTVVGPAPRSRSYSSGGSIGHGALDGDGRRIIRPATGFDPDRQAGAGARQAGPTGQLGFRCPVRVVTRLAAQGRPRRCDRVEVCRAHRVRPPGRPRRRHRRPRNRRSIRPDAWLEDNSSITFRRWDFRGGARSHRRIPGPFGRPCRTRRAGRRSPAVPSGRTVGRADRGGVRSDHRSRAGAGAVSTAGAGSRDRPLRVRRP